MKIKTILLLSVLINSFLSAQTINLDSALIAYYSFDQTMVDSSGNNHNAFLNSGSYGEDIFGVEGNAITFNGIDDFVTINHHDDFNFDLEDDFTISVWIKMPPTQVDLNTFSNDIISKWFEDGSTQGKGYPFVIRTSNFQSTNGTHGFVRGIRYNSPEPTCSETSDVDNGMMVNDDIYHHVLFGKKDSMIHLFMDGIQVDSTVDLNTCSTINNGPIQIGKRGMSGAQQSHFRGSVDELRFYKRFLNLNEIGVLYNDPTLISVSTFEAENIQMKCNYEVFPNPNLGYFTLEIQESIFNDHVELSIYSAVGNEVISKQILLENQTKIHFSDFSKGIYFIEVRSNGVSSYRKIIVN